MRRVIRIGVVVAMALFMSEAQAGRTRSPNADDEGKGQGRRGLVELPERRETRIHYTKARFSAIVKVMSKKNPKLADVVKTPASVCGQVLQHRPPGCPRTSSILVVTEADDVGGKFEVEYACAGLGRPGRRRYPPTTSG